MNFQTPLQGGPHTEVKYGPWLPWQLSSVPSSSLEAKHVLGDTITRLEQALQQRLQGLVIIPQDDTGNLCVTGDDVKLEGVSPEGVPEGFGVLCTSVLVELKLRSCGHSGV